MPMKQNGMLYPFTQHTVDPLALMSNVSHQQYYSQSSTTPPSTYVPPHFADNTQLDSGLSPMDNLIENLTNTLALLTQSYKTYLPQTNNQLRTSSNTRNQATVQDGRVVVQNVQGRQNRGQGNNARGRGAAGYGGHRTELGMLIQVKHGRLSGQDNAIDEDVDEQPVQDLALNVDNYVKDNAMPVVQSNVSSVPNDAYMMIYNDMYEPHAQSVSKITRNTVVDNSLTVELATYKEQHHLGYSKENYLATFTPQKQLTPEQIFWSQDLIKMNAEALKNPTTASRPIKALTVYPPNTPATLVPGVKRCFGKPTKECYLTEVIPFFKTKEHFEGIQKALTKEIKEMKDIFEELEAEVDQNGVDRKHDEIERKNLLIANDNLIADCLSKEVFYVATNSELNVSSFTEMHDAHTSLKARCLELEVELSNLRDKIQKDNHNELVKRFSNLENKLSCVNKDHVKPKVLALGKYAIDVEPIPRRNRNNREVHLVYLKHLKESVETLRGIVKEAKVERPLDSSLASAYRYTKHSQELLEYVIGTCPKALNTRDNKHASTFLPKKKQVTFEEQCAMSKSNTHKPVEQLNCQKTNVPVPPSTGVNSCTDASRSQPRSNTKKNRILPAESVNMKKVEEHPRTIKSSLKTTNHVDSSISSKHTIINLNSHSVCQTCNKCLIFANHDMCVVTYLHSVNASPSVKNVVRKVKEVWKPKQVKQVWKPTGNILTTVGHLNHLPPKDKKILSTAVNLWIRNLVIRQRVEDFQLGIESYQTQLNLTKPRLDATGFEFKHEFTVIDSPRAVTFRDKYGVQMIMRFNEIHKFNDGTLQHIDEALDYRVKEFKVNSMNSGLNTRFWTRKDVERSKEFMFTIQKQLKTRRIFRNLESFVGGRIREGDYILLQ
ncbi:hypothetical protein Tco_0800780 [Tanacetum coccineum]|uniref:Uncharacterized protein n=1 Tax=Tanacetum coccineum TaxID=301880 RepID=A0ABQ4ZV23_9ASTR